MCHPNTTRTTGALFLKLQSSLLQTLLMGILVTPQCLCIHKFLEAKYNSYFLVPSSWYIEHFSLTLLWICYKILHADVTFPFPSTDSLWPFLPWGKGLPQSQIVLVGSPPCEFHDEDINQGPSEKDTRGKAVKFYGCSYSLNEKSKIPPKCLIYFPLI